jgi:hypothetical protein
MRTIAVLDQLPDSVRGLLAALWLVALLWAFERFVVPRERWAKLLSGYRWRIAHCRSALLALLLVPPAVALFPQSRLPVFVDVLPMASTGTVGVLRWLVLGWLLIACLAAVLRYRERAAARRAIPAEVPVPESDQASRRARHWQQQLGVAAQPEVVFAAVAHPCLRARRGASAMLVLPRGAAHWPAAVLDVALIRLLCEHCLRHAAWLAFASYVGCLYWPFSLVRDGYRRLLDDSFDEEAWALASACYRDPLGFRRARAQLEERLAAPGQASPAPAAADATDLPAADPYGQVFVTFAQLLLAVYLLTGLTLREIPDDSNFQYAEFVDDWYKLIQRAPEYQPGAPGPAEPGATR